jgi:autophagy-related protein 16
MEPQPAGCWRADILSQLKQRNRSEVAPFQALLLLQSRLMEQSAHLQTENAALSRLNQSLKEEKVQLEAALQARAAVNQVADSHTIHELQMKMFNLQEELTELHRCGDGFLWLFFLQKMIEVHGYIGVKSYSKILF